MLFRSICVSLVTLVEGVCWVLPWKGRGRGSGKVGWMGWVLNCRGSDWLAIGVIEEELGGR